MPLPPHVASQLDEAARKARSEFEAHWQEWSVRDVAVWWRRWCVPGGTNRDRLGRILVEVTGVKPVLRRRTPIVGPTEAE
jgi:hypothetical protein